MHEIAHTHQTIGEVAKSYGCSIWRWAEESDRMISGCASITAPDGYNQMTWCRAFPPRAAFGVIISENGPEDRDIDPRTTVILAPDARLAFARVAKECFPEPGWMDPWSRMVTDGFGWIRNEVGQLEKFPHYGGVVLGDLCTIHPSARIARGSLSDTIVGDGVKIDNMVHIAHGVQIGEWTSIAALSSIEGSVRIGKRCTIGSGVIFQVGSSCGDDVTVGSGSVVTKHIPDGETWVGVPARKIR